MEVIDKVKTKSEPTLLAAGCESIGARTRERSSQQSSFDCDSSAMDSILGLPTNGGIKLRLDMAESRFVESRFVESRFEESRFVESRWGPPCHTESKVLRLEADAEFKRERLLRLLAQQQAWYDAAHQAALAAQQLLSLCEHHQQQWLQPKP